MMRAIDWFAQFIGADGLLTIPEVFGWETGGTPDRPAKTVWNFIDWQGDVQLKGEAARLTINCQYYGALATAAELAESAGRAGDAARWRSARESLAAPLLAAVTGGGAGFEHVAAYAALTKLAPQLASSVAANALAGRMQSDFLYLWFALKSIEDSPAALMRGLRDAMAPAIRDGFGTVLETRGTLTQPTTALCQGVGACGGYFLNRIVAGLQPSPRRQRQVLVRPWLDEVEWVEAVTPVADGDIAISLRRRKSGIDGEIRLPSGWDWHSDGPAGLTIRSR